MDFNRSDFPEDFLFGAATAAYQIEGSTHGGAGSCHWDSFARVPGNVIGAEDGSRACDHYLHWEADLDLLRAAGMDAYRFSTSWARVLPEGRGPVNTEALDFYDRLVDGMLERGLRPFHTIYHWEMPSALADLGGWTNPDVHNWFAEFTQVITRRIGDRVHATATINEPWCVSYLSHFLGHHAPGLRDIRATARAMHHVLKAHGAAMEVLRAEGRENCGIVLNFEADVPAEDGPDHAAAAARQDAIMNRWFLEGITRGSYPQEALEGLEPHLPAGWQDDMAAISQPIDWLGVNYYTRGLMRAMPDMAWPAMDPVPGPLPKTQMGWEVFPQGLEDTLTRLSRDYVGDLPVYVTENGMAWDDHVIDGAVHDPARISFISEHVEATHNAMDKGTNVRGFFYWSLLDNYEWAFGYEKRFGMVHVDYETMTRTPKASFHEFAKALGR
ncbi:MAG: GH1 family beta-glucosidase [Salibaculum sp.]|uniref:GH1 family beta-glucosidase n=1 Tax=Roseovarius halophilus (ex Wu et al. 2025) TaxID=3376060 RepID=UPI00286FC236|nr:GH1 family beta-glucosidase [Salibaculum sp.]MDR9481825.1 GH1 family beta-glucosidase [Salibaculum sp.]